MAGVSLGILQETMKGFMNISRNSSSLRNFEHRMYTADPLPLTGQVFILTGATHGLGQGMAAHLLAWGASLVLPCRKMYPDLLDRLFLSATALRAKHGGPEFMKDVEKVDIYLMDLSDLHSIEACVDAIRKNYEHIHVLINNAGLINHTGAVSAQGVELSFAVNFLGTAYFTQLLIDSGLLGPRDGEENLSRIVSVSSEGHRGSKEIDTSRPLGKHSSRGIVDTMSLYDYSKLCQVTWFLELARRQQEKQVVHDVCPGPIASNIAGNVSYIGRVIGAVLGVIFPSPLSAALPVLRLAVDPAYAQDSGKHYHIAEQKDAREDAQDAEKGQWLWEQTETLVETLLKN